eukprot:SAG11_NODE_476_length_9118_cov_5.515911_5_plen_126_part_00
MSRSRSQPEINAGFSFDLLERSRSVETTAQASTPDFDDNPWKAMTLEAMQKPENVRPPSTIRRKAKKMAAVHHMARVQFELEIETEDARSAASQEELASVQSDISVVSSDSMMSALTRSEISASE